MDKSLEETDPSQMEYALKRSLISRNKLAVILKTDTGDTEYCCVECSAKYSQISELEVHLCTHNKQYRYLCGICGTGLKRKEHLDRHTMEHNQVRPHKCQECGKAFKRKEHLNIHMNIHTGEKDQVCTYCDRSFNRKDHLQKHLQTHSKEIFEENSYPVGDQEQMEIKEEPEYIDIDHEFIMEMKQEVVDEDVKPSNSEDSYMEYEPENPLDNVDPSAFAETCIDVRTPDSHTTDRPFVCPLCYKSYKRKDHLKIHSWTHLKKDKLCSGCGKGFHKDSQLAAHMHSCIQWHIKRRTECDGEQYDVGMGARNSLLVETIRNRIDPESRPHECVVCHRRFKRKQHLKVHANVHFRQEVKVWCPLCNEGFLSKAQLEEHRCNLAIEMVETAVGQEEEEEDEDEGTEGEAPASGATRRKKENKYPGLLVPMSEEPSSDPLQLAQDEQNIPVPQRVFVCRYCQKPFKRRDHYKIHLHIHTGVKDYFCPDCGKGFYRKDHLQKHSQTHSKSKPKLKKQLPDLFPISLMQKKSPAPQVKPEITITAPSSSKLRVPLQIKVPYQVVVAGEPRRAVTVHPLRA